MAGTFAQHLIDAGPESIQHLQWYKGLNRAGKAAAVDPEAAPIPQQMLAQGQGNGYILVLGITGGDDILQVHVGALAALAQKMQEGVKISPLRAATCAGTRRFSS